MGLNSAKEIIHAVKDLGGLLVVCTVSSLSLIDSAAQCFSKLKLSVNTVLKAETDSRVPVFSKILQLKPTSPTSSKKPQRPTHSSDSGARLAKERKAPQESKEVKSEQEATEKATLTTKARHSRNDKIRCSTSTRYETSDREPHYRIDIFTLIM